MSAPKYSSASFIAYDKLTIPAGEKVSRNCYGRVFVCIEASGRFRMNFNDGEFFDVPGRSGWALNPDDAFNRLQFTADTDTTIEFYTGSFFYLPTVPPIQQAKTRAVPKAVTTIAAGANIDLTTIPAGLGHRKAVIVTNNDPSVDLEIYTKDAAGAWQPAATILHQQAWTIETSDDVRVNNPSAGVINLRIVELFYS